MPTRLLRDGIIDSQAVNLLSLRGEVFYRRLMSVVDDYGRFEADPVLLRARLFPRQMESWTEDQIGEALGECSQIEIQDGVPLVLVYRSTGRRYLQISNFGQRIQSQKSKYPAPNEEVELVPTAKGKVYFIQGEQSKRIKIGYTEWEPKGRLATLQVGSSEPLLLLGFFEGQRKDETALHREFSEQSLIGEWFASSEELLDVIKTRCNGCPRVSTVVNGSPPPRASRAHSESESDAKTESKSSLPASPKNGSSTTHGSRFSEEFLPAEWEAWSVNELHWTVEKSRYVFLKFADYWREKAGASGRKVDWIGTWRNWCRRDEEESSKRNGLSPPTLFPIRESPTEKAIRVGYEQVAKTGKL